MQYLPNVHIVYDKFHMVQEANKRLDEVRKAEAKEKKLLKGHRFTFLHLRKNLPEQNSGTSLYVGGIFRGRMLKQVQCYCSIRQNAVPLHRDYDTETFV